MKKETQKKLNSELQQAARDNDPNLFKKLLDQGANIHADKEVAITGAIINKCYNVLEIIAEIHLSQDDKTIDKDNALVRVAEHCPSTCHGVGTTRIAIALASAKLLLKLGADPKKHNNLALRSAASIGNHEMVQLLSDNGADPRACTNHALQIAARNGYNKVVQELINRGANVGQHNDLALYLAENRGKTEVAKTLVKAGAVSRTIWDSTSKGAIELWKKENESCNCSICKKKKQEKKKLEEKQEKETKKENS